MSHCSELTLEPGDILYREGDANDCGYVIETGEVILYNVHEGIKVFRERRGAGAIIGELSILTGQPRTVTVEATQPCRVFTVAAEQIVERLNKLEPVLRACIDTSISFSATLENQTFLRADQVSLAESTLRNSEDVIELLKIETDLLSALENREFKMLFQPIVCMTSEGIIGAEALMRWQHPQRGQISPARFIPVAEHMGAIQKLTAFAIHEACLFLRHLREDVGNLGAFFVSVNVSAIDIVERKFTDLVSFALDQYEIPACHLKLEITESAVIAKEAAAQSTLQRLLDLGCGVAIDDFGTGFSNFSQLGVLPFSTLKIDRAFIQNLHLSQKAQDIVEMLLLLCERLGVDVIAEGMETIEEVKALRRLQCPNAQGFHFYKPLPPDALSALIQKRLNEFRDTA
ncbi:MAG: EAL domain-containing protein [Pseudomonadota bacterium]